MSSVKIITPIRILASSQGGIVRAMASFSGDFGSGAGKGGGSGGAVRDAGGSLGKREAAQEEQYFRKQQAEQLAALHNHIEEEIREHEKIIKQHQEAIKRSKEKLASMKK